MLIHVYLFLVQHFIHTLNPECILYHIALPFVSEVCIKELGSGAHAGEGKYYGGYEGSSLYSWYRETNEGTIVLISGANSATYEVTDSDYNCRLLFGYQF